MTLYGCNTESIINKITKRRKVKKSVGNRAQLQCDGTYAEDSFHIWAQKMIPYSLTVDMRVRQYSSLLAAGFCVGVAHKGLTHSTSLLQAGLCCHIVSEL